jgi:hypothetical protein
VSISHVVVSDADPRYPSIIAGIPGHPVEDVRLSDIRIVSRGGLSLAVAAEQPANLVNGFFRPPGGTGAREPYAVPEREKMYPEPSQFGVLPAYGFYLRHAAGITLDGVTLSVAAPDTRPAIVLEGARDVTLRGVRTELAPKVPALVLRDVERVRVTDSPPLRDRTVTRAARDSIALPATSALETR